MTEPVLELADVELCYDSRPVLQDLRLRVQCGEWIGVVGPNASGKSTLLRSAAARLPPRRGMVLFEGASLYPLKVTTRLPGYAAPPEDLPSFLTLRQCMQIHAAAYGLGVVPEASEVLCRDLGLAPHLEKLVAAVSLGTRQKLSIALALMNAPSLLLLDEVFNGLDISSALVLKRHLRDLVHDRGMSILLATHALDVVAGCCDGVLLLDSGRLVRQWDAAALAQLRNPGELELALAAALADQPNRPVM